jgi:N6-adenosine-specific RNA methylase IME4
MEQLKKTYDIVYMDPPWAYGSRFYHSPGNISTIEEKHYSTLTIPELKQIDLNSMLNRDALVYMWVTSAFLEASMDLARHWGLRYSSVAFVWQKGKRILPGYYTLGSTEQCLVFRKGKIPQPRGSKNERQFLQENIREHSRKPDEIRDRITRMHPTQSKLEMFARTSAEGWDVWGNETHKF